ncbi:MAG: lamin tail domain-containing protein, partial [Phycisphaerae bacterium]
MVSITFRKITLAVFYAFLLLNAVSQASLVHRYSFTSSTADSAGGADGVLVNNSSLARFTGGMLDLGNDDNPDTGSNLINYVDLPNGIISSLFPSATIECWVTWKGPAVLSGQRVFDFGTSDLGEDSSAGGGSSGNMSMTAQSGGGVYQFVYRNDSSLGEVIKNTITGTSALPLNEPVYIAVTWDDVTGIVRLYIDGALIGSAPAHYNLKDLPDNNNWLGRSQFTVDSFNGFYDELRMYDTALTTSQIQANYAAGSATVPQTYAIPSQPSLSEGAASDSLTPVLSWVSDAEGPFLQHRIYLGTNFDTVLKATPSTAGVYAGTREIGNESFNVSVPLDINTTYYWRVEELTTLGVSVSGPVWEFTTSSKAVNPVPLSGAVLTDAPELELSWQPAAGVVSHDLYAGLSADSLELVATGLSKPAYTLSRLLYETEYFWRVDENMGAGAVSQGDIWSFTTSTKPWPCLPADLNGDCTVDIDDLLLFSGDWASTLDCSGFGCADLNNDSSVNMPDFPVMADEWLNDEDPLIVINEINYHPESNTHFLEFIEIYNAGAKAIDITGWYFGGFTYSFPQKTIRSGEYLVLCQNRVDFKEAYGLEPFGQYIGKLSNEGEKITLYNSAGKTIDTVTYGIEFPWPIAADGEGASIELINPGLDNDLAGSWRCSGYNSNRPEYAFGEPTPAAQNSVYAITAPPQIRQVNHSPNQPLSTEPVTITAKVTDPQDVGEVRLKYQVVLPGAYIPAYLTNTLDALFADPYVDNPINPAFEAAENWQEIVMVDDGTGADEIAGDDVYTAQLSAQPHRTLMRYRVWASDTDGKNDFVPHADNPSLNFAYYVYDGVPDYVASRDSVVYPGYTHSAETLTSIPVYQLITRYADFYMANGYDSAHQIDQNTFTLVNQLVAQAYNWEGAFVYDRKVYDHIRYRLRGGNGRYNYGTFGGKRSMKFRFNRGNYFQARDMYGEKLPAKVNHINTGKMFGNQVSGGYRNYAYGVNEMLNYKLFQQADVPTPEAWWFHFRVVDGAQEAPATSSGQYDGDFYGLYLCFENYDKQFMDRLDIGKGNLYKLSDKINDGLEQLRYQGPLAVESASDYENIRWNLNANADVDFIRNHLDCDEWYRYHTVTEAIRHYDVFSGGDCWHCLKNMAWYFTPEYTSANNYFGKLQFMPFDFDDTWGPYWNQGVDHAKAAIYDQEYLGSLTQFSIDAAKEPLKIDYRNYIREFTDLHWTEPVINGMIDELASVIEDFVPADRDRWRLDDVTPGSPLDFNDLATDINIMKTFAWNTSWAGGYWPGSINNLNSLANDGDYGYLPYTPTIAYTGSTGYPRNDLKFSVSAFDDPQGSSTFSALEWRFAEYDLGISEGTGETKETNALELIGANETWSYFKATEQPSDPIDYWTTAEYSDEEWLTGQTSIGYADNDDSTELDDMRSNYNGVYLRKTFEAKNVAKITNLTLGVYIDDGCIVYINGVEAGRYYCGEGDKYYDSLTEVAHHEAESYEQFSVIPGVLVEGDNLIAVHALQVATSSSDFSIDITLNAEYDAPGYIPDTTLKRHKYELSADWESGEITDDSNLSVYIPPVEAKTGDTYRVRCRMKDSTGRWSHWSDPIEFVAGEQMATETTNYLRVSEVMYNPAPDPADVYNNDSFEFIELANISTAVTLDLSTVTIEDGIEFDFATAAITTLAPGEHLVVVEDVEAFNTRYPGLEAKIAGQYGGKLSNSGETIELVEAWNGTIVDFTYNDGLGWPAAADGYGHSIVPAAW